VFTKPIAFGFASLLSCASAMPAATAAAPATPAVRLEAVTIELADGSQLQAEEGTLVVPAHRTSAGGGTLELHFVRIPGAAGAGPTPTLYLPGGPGESATGMLRAPYAPGLLAAFRAYGDFVLLDQRGTGRSSPVPACPSTGPLPRDAFIDGPRMSRLFQELVTSCAADWKAKGVDPAAFNSREAADDIDDLRRALGVDRVHLVGFSYGTHLALAVMRRHSAHLGRVVLIGTEGPAHTYKLPSTLDLQLAKLSALAAEDPAINRQVPDMLALLRRALAQLDAAPVTVTVRDRTTGGDVQVAVGRWGLLRILRWDVGDGNDFIAFPALLHGIVHGDPSLLARYVEKRWNQLNRGVSLMPIATDCASGASSRRWEQIVAESPGSVFGEVTNFPFPDVCVALGSPDLGDDYRGPISGGVPTLFVSGTLDSNTPPYQAEEIRWGLTRASHLIVENAGHEDTIVSSEVQRTIHEFLAGGEVSGRHVALPRPKFLSLEAAKSFRP
jgi:pimeloyl-ACP methyl ester carboxylesterase